jgi:putative ABC transport system permease protein
MTRAFLADEEAARSRGVLSWIGFWLVSAAQAAWFGCLARVGHRATVIGASAPRLTGRWWELEAGDVSRALKAIRARRWQAVASVALLTSGLAVATMAFSLADSMVFHRLPYPQAHRLVEFRGARAAGGGSRVLPPEVAREWRKHSDLFSAVHAYDESAIELVSEGRPAYLWTATITPGLLEMLGARPLWGRTLVETDALSGAESVVVISEDLARRRFGESRDAIGKVMPAVAGPMTVVGIMPGEFMFPRSAIRAWRAGAFAAIGAGSSSQRIRTLAQMAPGLSIDQLNRQLTERSPVISQIAPSPWPYITQATPGIAEILSDRRDSTFVLSLTGVAWALLLAAWAAVAGIELAGAATRSRRYAIQLALGATRARLAAGLCAEAIVLFSISTLAAALVSRAGVSVLSANLAEIGVNGSFLTNAVDLDVRALLFLSSASVILWLAALVPVLTLAGRSQPIEVLRRDPRAGAIGRVSLLRRGFSVFHVALAVALLVFAMLCVRTYTSLAGIDKGFDPRNVAIAVWSVRTPRPSLAAEADALAERLRARPEIEGVVRNGQDPFSMQGGMPVVVEIDGRPRPASGINLRVNRVRPEYFELMRLPLSRGRLFRHDESPDSVIVSDSFVERFSPAAEILGTRVRLDASGRWRHVVGVVPRVRHQDDGLVSTRPREHEIYEPIANEPESISVAFLLIRFRAADPRRLIEEAVRAADPRAAYRVDLLDEMFSRQLTRQRSMMQIASVFGGLALMIAMAGIYAVMASMVTARTREIGIRVALGATGRDIRDLVLGSTLRLVIVGVALGLLGVVAGARLVSSLFYGVTARDPLTYAVVAALLATTALVATSRPLRRARRVDPALTLREE